MGVDGSMRGRSAAGVPSLVPAGGRFEGRVVARDIVRLDGEIVGPVHVDGLLLAGTEARIQGDVDVCDVILAGCIEGTLVAHGRAHLETGATVRGTLRTPELRMDEGATLEGRCQAGEPE